MRRQIVLDTETTGLNPANGDRIIEVAAVELVNRRPSGRHFQRYVNPERSSHPDAVKVHGLTDAFLADKPLFAQIAQDLLDFVAGAEVIIHNAAFDVGFLDAELQRLGLPGFAGHCGPILDSLQLARQQFPGKFNSLDALCKRFGVDNSKRDFHGALLDAELLAEVYLWLTRGQDSLVIETAGAAEADTVSLDASAYRLTLLRASADELAAHQAIVDQLGAQAVWREQAETSSPS